MPKPLFAALWLLLAAGTVQASGEFYCCPDPANGRRICADTLPDQCRGRAYRVLDSGGNIIKEVGPPLTPEQKTEQAAEAKRKKLIDEANREQRRKDQALLDTYTTRQDIDLAQEKAESDVKLTIQDANTRIFELNAKRKKFEAESEFYKKKTMPADLAKELRTLEYEIKLQQELIEVKKQELTSVRNKYEADRKRYNQIVGNGRAGTPSNGATAAAPR